jgi:hypothetical protein
LCKETQKSMHKAITIIYNINKPNCLAYRTCTSVFNKILKAPKIIIITIVLLTLLIYRLYLLLLLISSRQPLATVLFESTNQHVTLLQSVRSRGIVTLV